MSLSFGNITNVFTTTFNQFNASLLNNSTDLFENCISSFRTWPILAFDSLSLTHSHKLYCALCIVKNTILECTARSSLKIYIFNIADREKQISQCALHVVFIRA